MPGDAVDLLFERRRDRVGHDLRARAGIDGADDDLRRRDVGKLRDRQQEVTDRARQHHNDGDRRREDRTLDEKSDHGHDAPHIWRRTSPGWIWRAGRTARRADRARKDVSSSRGSTPSARHDSARDRIVEQFGERRVTETSVIGMSFTSVSGPSALTSDSTGCYL